MYNRKAIKIGQFVYFGLEKGIRHSVNVDLHENRKLQLQFNIDGVPLFKSAKKQFWPILCKIFCNRDI